MELAPTDPLEAAIILHLPAGVVHGDRERGELVGRGVGLAEVYNLL